METMNKSPEKPRRNLSEAFEALCIVSPEDTTKEEKTDLVSSSPTGVAEITETLALPEIILADDLKRDLSNECIARISAYSIIHDINKEATTLAAHDPLSGEAESQCPLILAIQGASQTKRTVITADQAIVDEEKWLLTEIQSITEAFDEEMIPATFHQAMGEKEYENPHRVGRTQLWKPSRSWWEAKSGKNPWIEPTLHNKRWRYLWPLIHYHKFLAKCIKKLKRNGLDVTMSPNPISVFLRQEVCAISDHLASVSLFGSDIWMKCLSQFNGWIDSQSPDARKIYRRYVRCLPLRSMKDPADVDSPVLRDQINEALSQALTQHCNEMTGQTRRKVDSTAPTESTTHQQQQQQQQLSEEPENIPRNIRGDRRYYGWYDANSVHSELSTNSYSYDYHHNMYMHQHNYYSEPPQNTYAPAYPWLNYYPMYTYDENPATPVAAHHHPQDAMSPYWGHLEQVAAMGLATPSTPARRPRKASPKK